MSDYLTAQSHDFANLADLQELAIRVQKHSVPDNPVIFYGSSSFRLWDPTIRTDLDSNKIVNLAFGGSTLVTCGDHFERIMKPYREAKSMVIYAGDNDLGDGRSANEVEDAFLKIIDKVRKRFGQIPVFFVSIKPSPSKQSIFETIVESNRLIREQSEIQDNLHYIDIFTPMLTSSGQSNPAYFLEDMLHMNEAGYQVWKTVMLGLRKKIGF
ncbi:GDSL-type esterase/lipase family protein [bacterium]|nr:GDSL-type esterase/lipase family protein [bacterium]